MFDLQPVLHGTLVTLRPLQPADRANLYAAACDPLIWEQHPCKTRHEREEFDVFFDESLESGGALVILDAADDRLIGSSRYHGVNLESSEVEIGWTFLARSHWGGKYNEEVKERPEGHLLVHAGPVRS